MHGNDCSALTERADAIGTANHVFKELGLASPVFRTQLVIEAFQEEEIGCVTVNAPAYDLRAVD